MPYVPTKIATLKKAWAWYTHYRILHRQTDNHSKQYILYKARLELLFQIAGYRVARLFYILLFGKKSQCISHILLNPETNPPYRFGGGADIDIVCSSARALNARLA